jgi:hypothetical protein
MCGLALIAVLAAEVRAESKAVKFTKEWKGSVAEEALQKDAPKFVTDAKALETLWKLRNIEDKLPKIDFTKEIVVLGTTKGTRIRMWAKLDDRATSRCSGTKRLTRLPASATSSPQSRVGESRK